METSNAKVKMVETMKQCYSKSSNRKARNKGFTGAKYFLFCRTFDNSKNFLLVFVELTTEFN